MRISRKFRRFIPPPLLLSIFSGFCSFRGSGAVGKCGKSLIVPKDENDDDDSTSLNGHAASGGATTNPANMAPNVLCLLCKCSFGYACLSANKCVTLLLLPPLHSQFTFSIRCFLFPSPSPSVRLTVYLSLYYVTAHSPFFLTHH